MAKVSTPAASPANRLLARLPLGDFQRLALKEVPLNLRQVIYRFRAPIEYVYFPLSGIISAMTMMEDGRSIEVATIGNEGMSGLTAFVGGETSPNEVMVQVPGQALRMEATAFHEAARREGPLRKLLLRYNTAFSVQVSYSVACNGLHTIDKRCARWLLMTHDRVGSNLLPLTHEFLAIMLGVRRASVTEVLRPLKIQGVIRNIRGAIEILDRARLEQLACECYATVNSEFERLLG